MIEIVKIFISSILAFIIIYLLGAFFLESCMEAIYDDTLQIACPRQGIKEYSRSENWCTNQYGKLGFEIHDEYKLNHNKNKILIYGDSYVEAKMLPWYQRVQNQIQNDKYDVLGIGCSGWSSIEFNDIMHRYKAIIKQDIMHVIILADINDVLPSENNSFTNRKPRLRQVKSNIFRRFVIKYKANIIYHLYKKLISQKLNFNIKEKNNFFKENYQALNNEHYWYEMLNVMKSNSPNGNLLFIYIPTVPRIHHNKLDFIDDSGDIAMAFQKACKDNNVGFINLVETEIRYYHETKRFCRGFPLSRPGEGHCNADGHRLIAQAIEEYINQCNLLK